MATHGSIREFVASQKDWKSYMEWLQQYFTKDDVVSAEKQLATQHYIHTKHATGIAVSTCQLNVALKTQSATTAANEDTSYAAVSIREMHQSIHTPPVTKSQDQMGLNIL